MSETQRRVIWIPKKPPVTTAPQQAISPAQLRREEYKDFGTQYVAPVLASGLSFIEQERAAEEAKLREAYAAQLAEAEKAAKIKFEADLKAERAAAVASFESGLTVEKGKSTFESALASQEAAARAEFQAELRAKKGELVEAPLRAVKREYAMTYKQQMLPRHYRAIRTGAETTFATLAQTEQEALEQQVSTWKSTEIGKQQQAVKDWETSQRSAFEEELKPWESEARASLEAEISTWKTGEVARLEGQIGEWRKTWQPKGLAERMMEIKAPSLDLGGRLATALGVGTLRVTPSGIALAKAPVVHPLAAPAGIVASVESLVYGVGQLAGLKTPRMPSTLTGGLISSGIESVMKGQLTASEELQKISKMEPSYAIGSVMGDILIAYGIGKAVKAGTKAVKGVASFVYEESGLKYSHALYEAKQTLLGIEEALPKSPIAALKESRLAYELSEAMSSVKHKILPTKFMKVPAEGIVGLPRLEEEVSLEGVTVIGKGTSKALGTATGIGLTPLEYGKAVYPKIFAGMELLGWTEAPRTAGLGLTVGREVAGKVVAKAALAEALAETMWIGSAAGEKWAVRAGAIPSPEDVIVQPPKQIGQQMIKGGRYFDIDVTRALGFSKFPYKEAAAGKFFFEKEKLPSLRDLLKETKAEARLSQLLEAPAKMVEPILPKLAMLPEAAGKVTVSQVVGISAALGLKPLSRTRAKPALKVSSLSEVMLKSALKAAPVQKVKGKQASLLKEIVATSQVLKTVSIQRGVFRPPLLKPPRKREEPLPRIKRAAIFGKTGKKKMAGYLYPVLPEKELPKYLRAGLGRRQSKVISARSFILGKRRSQNVFKQKVGHKRS
jgi:hypothetical protein